MREIGVTSFFVIICNAVFVADSVSDWKHNQLVERQQEAVELWWNTLIVWSLVLALLQNPVLFVNVKSKEM